MVDEQRLYPEFGRPAELLVASDRVVYLMRGLPCCGKSTAARRLAGESGVICETDAYFDTQVGDDPTRYDYRAELLDEARRWNFERFCRAVVAGMSPVVVDRGNSRSPETREYVRYAARHGYRVELREPDSPWWREVRSLLQDKRRNRPALEQWAERLAAMSRSGHRVPASVIVRWMSRWKPDLTVEDIPDLTVEDILDYEPPARDDASATTVIDAGLGACPGPGVTMRRRLGVDTGS